MAKVARKRTTAATAVRVEGLADFQRALRASDKTLTKELRLANRDVASAAVERARALATGAQAKAAVQALQARGEQRFAVLVLSDGKVPFAFGANFGAYHDRVRIPGNPRYVGPGVTGPAGPGLFAGYNQFPEWGGNQWTGGARDQFLYRSLGQRPDILLREYGEALDRLLARLASRT